MPYQVFVAIALTIHVLTNVDMFTKKDNIAAIKSYRWFALSIAAFYVSDILWGVFEGLKAAVPLYVDTSIYFLLMGVTVMFWTNFVIRYLEGNKLFSNAIRLIGVLFFGAEIALLIINIFHPVLFTVDENAVYEAYNARYVMLYAQIAMYGVLLIYSIVETVLKKKQIRRRYMAIILFSLVMIICISIQIGDPYIPFYSIGCLVGVCILDTFSLSERKEEKEHQLDAAITIAYHDTLTGVRSRYAFVQAEEEIDQQISDRQMKDLVIAVFDINGLKDVNDHLGHQEGDKLIINSAAIISSIFPQDSIYRYGGDEFVIVLKNEETANADAMHDKFMKLIDENVGTDKPIISSGIAQYRPESDYSLKSIFYRADKMMYERKEQFKERGRK